MTRRFVTNLEVGAMRGLRADGWSWARIGAFIGVSPSTVRHHLDENFRARHRATRPSDFVRTDHWPRYTAADVVRILAVYEETGSVRATERRCRIAHQTLQAMRNGTYKVRPE